MASYGAFTFPTYSIPEDKYTRERVYDGVQKSSLNGTVNTDTYNERWHIEFTAIDLTAAQLASLIAEIDARTGKTLVSPEGTSFSNVIHMGNPKIIPHPDNDLTPLYDADLVFEEAQ